MAALFVFAYSDKNFVDKLCRANGGRETLKEDFEEAKQKLTSDEARSLMERKPHSFEDACLALKDRLNLNDDARKLWETEEAKYMERVKDLIQTRPNFDLTMDGKYPVASIITESDLWQGSTSPGVFIAMCAQVLIGFAAWNLIPTHFLAMIAGGVSLILSFFLTKIIEAGRKGHSEDGKLSWVMMYALPAFGPKLWMLGAGIGRALGFGGGHFDSTGLVGAGVLTASLVLLLFTAVTLFGGHAHDHNSERLTVFSSMKHVVMLAVLIDALLVLPGVLMTMNDVTFVLGSVLNLIVPSLIGLWMGPWHFVKHMERSRTFALSLRDLNAQGTRNGLTKNAHRIFRFEQLMRAAKDPTPPIKIGEATGYLIQKGSRIAPEAGQYALASQNDLLQHTLVLGKSGSGKTSSTILPIATQWYINKLGGYLITCGKGVLPLDFKDVSGFTLIKPGLALGLYEGMTSQGITRAYEAVNETSKSQTGNGAFFVLAGQRLFQNITNLMFYVAEAELQSIETKVGQGQDKESLMESRAYKITPWTHLNLINVVKIWSPDKELGQKNIKLLALIDFVHDHHPLVKVTKFMSEKPDGTKRTEREIEYTDTPEGQMMKMTLDDLKALGLQDPETRSSVFETVANWINPLFSHPDLVAWTQLEQGVRLESVLEGAGMGLYLPADKYGQGAVLIQALIKNRVMTKIHLRDNDWKNDPTQREVLLVTDEAHVPGLVTEQDRLAVSQFRSKGAALVYAAQAVSSFVAAMGADRAQNLRDNFSTVICLDPGTATETRDFMQLVIGEGRVQTPMYPSGRLLVDATISYAAQLAAFDDDHPDRLAFLRLRRQGSHEFEELVDGSNVDHGNVSHINRNGLGAINTRLPLIRSVRTEFGPWLEKGEIDANLRQGVALVKWYRGGYAMHDFVKLRYMPSTTSAPK
ncbi:MAG: hypothetical protein B7X45_13115 [Lysobacterales bacterium 15-68-25]|nr:MAG: hypothetical protein B7X45_13115 [Xanthomonadales bacterium 15-68-25]